MHFSEQSDRTELYSVGNRFALPDLERLVPAGARMEHEAIRMQIAYFDTADHDLLDRGTTLRSRTAASTSVWELDAPGNDGESRLRIELSDSSKAVPRSLADLTFGARRGRPLQRTAILNVDRTAYRILSPDGQVLLELGDDNVHAVTPQDQSAILANWREIEIRSAIEGDGALRADASALLTGAKAKPSARAHQAARALGATPSAAPADKRGRKTAGAFIQRYIADQDQALVSGDLLLRRGADALHSTRVATRRFRSTLRVFTDFVDTDRARWMDSELAWLAGVLGDVRDMEVQRRRLSEAVAALPADAVPGAAASHIEEHLDSEKVRHQTALEAAMSSPRYAALLEESARWVKEPPFTRAARKRADALRTPLRVAAKKVTKHLDAGLRSGDDEQLHKARKAGKRARYAAELVSDVLGKKAKKQIDRFERLQDILGEHQDSTVAAEVLRGIAATAATSGDIGFTLGVLYAAQQERAQHSREKARSWSLKQ